MPSLFSRLKPWPGRCPRWLCCRRPLRRRLPPPPEFLPCPAFIVLSNGYTRIANFFYKCPDTSFALRPAPNKALPTHCFELLHRADCDGTHSGTNPKSETNRSFTNEKT